MMMRKRGISRSESGKGYGEMGRWTKRMIKDVKNWSQRRFGNTD